jgi:hypothetical protein
MLLNNSCILRLGLLCLLSFPVFAGQSVVLNTGSLSVTDPVLPANQSWRIEYQLHDWTPPPATVTAVTIFNLAGTGALAHILPGGYLDAYSTDTFSAGQPCFVGIPGPGNLLVRIQKDAPNKQFTCEVWNYDGTGYSNQVSGLSALNPRTSSGGTIGGGTIGGLGFLRIFTTLVPLGSRPPTTADGGNWTELKFDGNLKDSSGHGHNASGAASFMPTPNQVVIANPKVAGAPAWSHWISLRAGFPAQLDGSDSYSLADASSAVSCRWQQTSGPSTILWANQDTANPTLDGLIFGTYDFSLQVTDSAGNVAYGSLEAGAVATDDNGVVVNADPNVDILFGPMIAFGKNPWGYADERALTATTLRMAAYNAQGLNPPSWTLPQAGTVTYYFNGVGGYGAAPGTTLARAMTGASDTTIAVADASPFDLSSLPTRILLGPVPREEVRICGASATAGPALLTVCYDGRGQNSPYDGYRTGAQAWPAGTTVGQMKVKGSGTKFLSTVCPVGPGPNGPAIYNTGSVQLRAGSNSVTGFGTQWSTNNGVIPGNLLRVSATHQGIPFVFSAYIASVPDGSHLVLARTYPADADSGSAPYAIVQADTRQITLHYKRPSDGTDQQTFFQTTGCESDEAAFLYYGHDIVGLDGTLVTGVRYGYMNGYGYTSAYGANFYGEDLAHRALYYRSGWNFALQAARVFGDQYVKAPQLAGGDIGGIPLLIGGGTIGGFFANILDTNDPNRPAWTDLRGFARNGFIGGWGCNDSDSRDSGYLASWVTLAALYDPDPVQKANWQAQLQRIYERDQKCRGADNSWSNGFLWNNASVALNMTNGSAVATGVNIPPSICYGIASGTMSVTAGSASGLGGGFVRGNQIAVTGTMKGKPYTGYFRYALNNDGSITMGALWPGDSGTASFVIENNDNVTTIATSNNDPQMTKNWACTWNSPTQITLNRPWDGPAESGAHTYSYTIAGFGEQPYMLGIKTTQMLLGSHIGDRTMASGFAKMAAEAAGWIHSTGFDPVTQGLHYGRVIQACEPQTYPPLSPVFDSRTPGCNYGLDPSAKRAARVLTAEASQALRVYYEANPTPEAKAWGDLAYGSIWGYGPYTTGGVYSDSYYVKDENSNGALGSYKWPGFFFGMGMAHQWPAVRLGGVAPPRIRRVNLEVKQGIAAKARIAVAAPSGRIAVFPCGAESTCEVTVDDRQGSHWYRVQYLSEDGKLVSQSPSALIARLPVMPTDGLPRR